MVSVKNEDRMAARPLTRSARAGYHPRMSEGSLPAPPGTQKQSKAVLGCLLAALFPAALVSGLFVLVSIFGLVLAVGDLVSPPDDPLREPYPLWTGLVTLVFALPMSVLFVRGLYVVWRDLRGKPRRPLVSVGIAWMLAGVYGVPALIAAVALAVLRPESVGVFDIVAGLAAVSILVSAPFILARMRRDQTSGT